MQVGAIEITSLWPTESWLKTKVKRCLSSCCRIRATAGEAALSRMTAFARAEGVATPAPKAKARTPKSCMNRLCSDRWWLAALRKSLTRAAEASARERGAVRNGAGLYVSNRALEARRERKLRNKKMMLEWLAVNEDGECFFLAELIEHSVSNPILRRTEMMIRVRGCEEYAQRYGHVARFLTITTPSRFHAYDRLSGRRNFRFASCTPREGQEWLCKTWACARAKFCRLGLNLYGIRIAEPHHDGTPHWHILLFGPSAQIDAACQNIKAYFLRDAATEPGALKHRVAITELDPSKGSAAGYLAKYIAKNIDGYNVGEDFEDEKLRRDAVETAERVEAWASIWGIRQFQFLGNPPVSVHRELRRISHAVNNQRLELARQAADAGDWCAEVEAQGGMRARQGIVGLYKERSTDESIYGDPPAMKVCGVQVRGLVVVTREHVWFFVWAGFKAAPWTCVNNCTVHGSRIFGREVLRSPREGYQWLSDSS